MKLSQWAKQKGICYNTALSWYHQGRIPNSYQIQETGTIMVDESQQDLSIIINKLNKIENILNEILKKQNDNN